MKHVKITSINHATHDVMHIKTEKPQDLSFHPGQAIDVALTKPGWDKELRPFTFTSLPSEDYLEFFIKTYPDHQGVTNEISKLKQGDTLSIGDVFGDIKYKGEGIFIAGGAGITPFIGIFKMLKDENKIGNNKLIFANKTEADIIEQQFFNELLGTHFINVLSDEEKEGFEHGYINKEILKSHIESSDTCFYLCGPPPMMNAVLKDLDALGIKDDHIVKEQF